MKRKNKIIVVSIVVCVAFALLTAGSVFAVKTVLTDDSVTDNLAKQDLSLLFDEIDEHEAQGKGTEELTYYALALVEKLGENISQEFLEKILNSEHSDTLKVLLLQCCEYAQADIDYTEFADMLQDQTIGYDVRSNILANIYTAAEPDVSLIEKTARGADERLAFTALRYLWNVNPDAACTIADEIVENYDEASTYEVRGALMIMSAEFENGATKEKTQRFLDLCEKVMSDDRFSPEEDMQGKVFVALATAKTWDGYVYILSSEQFTAEQKIYTVGQHEELICEKLADEKLTQEDLSLILQGISLYNEKSWIPALSAATTRFVANDKYVSDMTDVISALEKNGE